MSCVFTCEVKVRVIYSGLLTIFPHQLIELSVLCRARDSPGSQASQTSIIVRTARGTSKPRFKFTASSFPEKIGENLSNKLLLFKDF